MIDGLTYQTYDELYAVRIKWINIGCPRKRADGRYRVSEKKGADGKYRVSERKGADIY